MAQLAAEYIRISIHTLREEGDPMHPERTAPVRYFYPRPPRGGRPRKRLCLILILLISIHALREEGDMSDESMELVHEISIHALREEGDESTRLAALREGAISIHALREEGDPPAGAAAATWGHISIHALREEGDNNNVVHIPCIAVFLSTPSARRATQNGMIYAIKIFNFYPRPPRGGRRIDDSLLCLKLTFLSTPSARRATSLSSEAQIAAINISIHALREEGDGHTDKTPLFHRLFLSTPSARRATCLGLPFSA